MKENNSHSVAVDSAHHVANIQFTEDDLVLICQELWHIINEVLASELGTIPGETFEESITLWRAHAAGFCRRLMQRGWTLEDAEFATRDKSRLADMLERAIAQHRTKSNAGELFRRDLISQYSENRNSSLYSVSLL